MQVISNFNQPIPQEYTVFHEMWEWLKKAIKPFLTWQYAVSYLLIYIPFTGMWYFWLWLGIKLNITWLAWVSGTWIGLLWSPFMPEKAFTIPLARKLQKKLFERKKKNEKRKI